MLRPTYPFSQTPMARALSHPGWCWGLSVRWLRECMDGGPSAAGLAMRCHDISLQAMRCHDTHVGLARRNICGGPSHYYDLLTQVTTFNLSARQMAVKRRSLSSAADTAEAVASITEGMNEGQSFYALLYLGYAAGAHAIALARIGTVWSLFDPNFGTWVLAGDVLGASLDFWLILDEALRQYMPHDVRLYEATRWSEPTLAVDCAGPSHGAGYAA